MNWEIIEQLTEGVKRQARDFIEQAYKSGYNAGYSKAENDYCAKTEDDRQSSYELGLNVAWEAARKLSDSKNVNEILDDTIFYCVNIFERHTASEAIEKLHAYEEQKKQEENTKFHVGDEVIYNCGNDKDKATVIDIDVDVLHLLTENGCYINEKFKDVKKTNRNFSEIAEVLKKMREGDGE